MKAGVKCMSRKKRHGGKYVATMVLVLVLLPGVAGAQFTKTIQVVPNVEVNAATTWFFASCTQSLGLGSYTINVAPTHGSLAFSDVSGPVPGCPVGSPSLPAAAAFYTWTDTTSGATHDFFQLFFILNGQVAEVIDVSVVLSSGLAATLVDPVPQLVLAGTMLGDNTSIGADLLATLGRVVTGVAADGTAEVLVRITGVSAGEQLTVSLNDDTGSLSGSTDEDGALGIPGDTAFSSNSVSVTAVSTSSGAMAFAAYRAPIDFPRAGNTTDAASASRSVSIQIQASDGETAALPVAVLRPPVILIHGIWSSAAETWGKFSPLYSSTGASSDKRFTVAAVDYSNSVLFSNGTEVSANALGFQFNAVGALSQLSADIESFKNRANPLGILVADVQADIVAHSMGGAITRSFAVPSDSYTFYSDDNFLAGSVHKLITIDTPHLGTPVAIHLLQPANSCIANMMRFFGEPPIVSIEGVSGAAGDLQGDGHGGQLSDALTALTTQGSAKLIPTATIAATENSANLSGLDSCVLCLARLAKIFCSGSELTPFMTSQNWQQIFSDASFQSPGDDALVPFVSQVNGLTTVSSAQLFDQLIHSPGTAALGFNGPSVLDDASGLVPNAVIRILNTPITDSTTFNGFLP